MVWLGDSATPIHPSIHPNVYVGLPICTCVGICVNVILAYEAGGRAQQKCECVSEKMRM